MPSACTEVPIKRCKEPCKIVKTKKGKQCKTKYIQRKTAKGKKGSKGSKESKGSNKTPKKKGSKGKKKGSKTKKQSALTEKAEEELQNKVEEELQNKVEDTTTEENKEEQPTMMTDPVKTMINSAPESVTNLFNTSTEQPTDVTTEVKEPEPIPETTSVPEEKIETS